MTRTIKARFAAPAAVVLWLLPSVVAVATEPAATPLPPLPPPATGRVVVADAQSLVFDVAERSLTLADLDPDESRVIAEINRSPSTWQCYLLYTQEDLPEKLFHPGFTIVLHRPKAGDARPRSGVAETSDESAAGRPNPGRQN
jgi:hypothetical protein